MARQLRKLYENAWYHVMNRGIDKNPIFYNINQKYMFLDLLEYVSEEFLIEIHSYCLMSNHYHLLIHTPQPNLDKAMKYLNGVYTMRVNRDLNRDGSLLRGRYNSKVVDKDNYFLHVSRYIHLNPVEAGMTINPAHYPWSSYRAYIKKGMKPDWLHTEKILECFGSIDPTNHYQTFVEDLS